MIVFGMVLSAALWSAFAAAPTPTVSNCTFTMMPVDSRWIGSCGRILDERPLMWLASAPAIKSGVWRAGVSPIAVWSGEMTEENDRNSPIELEVYPEGTGVLRTEFGWFPVSGYAASAGSLKFAIDAAHEVPPSELDRRIIERANAILSSDAVWNRKDDRRCPAAATSWSIYCAVGRASIEVTGGFHHRRPAMELVRQVIEERTKGRNYHHRMMDYNNDPSTKIEDVHSVFAEALARMPS